MTGRFRLGRAHASLWCCLLPICLDGTVASVAVPRCCSAPDSAGPHQHRSLLLLTAPAARQHAPRFRRAPALVRLRGGCAQGGVGSSGVSPRLDPWEQWCVSRGEGELHGGESKDEGVGVRGEWFLRAFACMFCGQWQMMKARRQEQREASEREASEQEAVREIARLFGKVFSIDDTLDLPSLLRGAQEGVSRGLNEVTEDTKAKIEAFFNLQPGYFSGIMAHGLVRGLQSAMSSTLGNAANALFRDKKESHRDVQWYSLDPFPPSPPTLRQPTPPPGWEPEALRDQEVSEMCPPSPLLPHIQAKVEARCGHAHLTEADRYMGHADKLVHATLYEFGQRHSPTVERRASGREARWWRWRAGQGSSARWGEGGASKSYFFSRLPASLGRACSSARADQEAVGSVIRALEPAAEAARDTSSGPAQNGTDTSTASVSTMLGGFGEAGTQGCRPCCNMTQTALLPALEHFLRLSVAVYGWRMVSITSPHEFQRHKGYGLSDLEALVKYASVPPHHILMHRLKALTYRPAFALVDDAAARSVVLVIRGSFEFADILTDLVALAGPLCQSRYTSMYYVCVCPCMHACMSVFMRASCVPVCKCACRLLWQRHCTRASRWMPCRGAGERRVSTLPFRRRRGDSTGLARSPLARCWDAYIRACWKPPKIH